MNENSDIGKGIMKGFEKALAHLKGEADPAHIASTSPKFSTSVQSGQRPGDAGGIRLCFRLQHQYAILLGAGQALPRRTGAFLFDSHRPGTTGGEARVEGGVMGVDLSELRVPGTSRFHNSLVCRGVVGYQFNSFFLEWTTRNDWQYRHFCVG
jgi:hypothetical protein